MATMLHRRVVETRRGIDPELAAFQQLFGTLAANPSVRRIAIDDLGAHLDLWVRLSDDDDDNEAAIYGALSAYHAANGVQTPVDLHVVFADEDETAFPADIQPLFHRQR